MGPAVTAANGVVISLSPSSLLLGGSAVALSALNLQVPEPTGRAGSDTGGGGGNGGSSENGSGSENGNGSGNGNGGGSGSGSDSDGDGGRDDSGGGGGGGKETTLTIPGHTVPAVISGGKTLTPSTVIGGTTIDVAGVETVVGGTTLGAVVQGGTTVKPESSIGEVRVTGTVGGAGAGPRETAGANGEDGGDDLQFTGGAGKMGNTGGGWTMWWVGVLVMMEVLWLF